MLSALSLEGSRSSERQMIASSWLLMIASVAFSYATPVDQMHPQRPLRSLFHPAIFISMAGQALIHLWTMHQAVSMARDEMGPDKLAEVVEFHRKERPRANPNPNPNPNRSCSRSSCCCCATSLRRAPSRTARPRWGYPCSRCWGRCFGVGCRE